MTDEDNWKIVKKQRIWGVSKRNRGKLKSVNLGDHLIFYITRNGIGGIFKVISNTFENDTRIFDSRRFIKEVFPYRVKLKPILIPKKFIEFKPFISQLRFIKRKDKKWATSIQGRAMISISKEDYEIIESSLR